MSRNGGASALHALANAWTDLPFPAHFGPGSEYAKRMHERPFDFYLQRLRQIDFRGRRVLDAGCGSGTWSFAMAADSSEVHAVDINSPRLDVARWIRNRYEIRNVHVSHQDVTRLAFPSETFDSVYCYGVVISYLSLPSVLAEFRRVLRSDGLLSMCLNGLGWSMYLRDERGKDSDRVAAMGRAGIYNSLCQRYLGLVLDRLSEVESREPNGPSRRKIRTLLETWKAQYGQPSKRATLESRRLFERVGRELIPGGENPLLLVADAVQEECGDEYLILLANDLVDVHEGRRNSFSHERAGRGYDPAEVEVACRAAGFEGFEWAAEGALHAREGQGSPGPIFGGWYRGHQQVWEFLARAKGALPHQRGVEDSVTAPTQVAPWSVRDESWVKQHSALNSQLLKYPYPYKSALAISNDTDGMSLESLDALHDFTNGARPTRLGDGLSLEVGDSFWIWNPEGQLSLFHSMPYDQGAPLSPEAGRIIELSESGFMDTLHGFGAWSEPWAMDSDSIHRGLETLGHLGLYPTVYINHGGGGRLHGGGGRHMKHNIGGPWGYYQEGDVPGSRSYCLDALKSAGFSYFWTDVCFEKEKFGEYQEFRNQKALNSAVGRHDFARFFRRKLNNSSQVRPAFPNTTAAEVNDIRRRVFNKILIPLEARDGNQVFFFKRYRGPFAPNSGNFAFQVNTENLDDLEAKEAAVVIYQHFGIWRAFGMPKSHSSERRTMENVLDEHGVAAFVELARRQEAGRLFITTTARLLEFLWVRDYLEFGEPVNNNGDDHIIALKGVQCPVRGSVALTERMLQGIGFRIPRSWKRVTIVVDGMANPPKWSRTTDPASDDRDVIYFSWTRLEYPRSSQRKAHRRLRFFRGSGSN